MLRAEYQERAVDLWEVSKDGTWNSVVNRGGIAWIMDMFPDITVDEVEDMKLIFDKGTVALLWRFGMIEGTRTNVKWLDSKGRGVIPAHVKAASWK